MARAARSARLPAVSPNYFSSNADGYARFRPTYPEALYAWIAERAPAREMVWDCACGSGQATDPLTRYFGHVVATDASADQLVHAPPYPRVIWKHSRAEASGLPDASVDVITIAQALHWFDHAAFWPEVDRVVKPGGLVVAWSYGRAEMGHPLLDAAIARLHDETLGPWWPAERQLVLDGYANVGFPYPKLEVPSFSMSASWALEDFLGYVRSWSAMQRLIDATGVDPTPACREALVGPWGSGPREIRWPLTILAGHRPR